MTAIRHDYAISIYKGSLGFSTKKGFTPFRYDEYIAWAKKQGPKYARLHKPIPKRFIKRKGTKRSLCAKLHLKTDCRCVLIGTDSFFPDRTIISPTSLEVELWLASERDRKASHRKSGLRICPRCPAELIRYSCPFAESFTFDDVVDEADPFSDNRPEYWKNWTDCKITEAHFKPGTDALDAWLDAGHTVKELIQLISEPDEQKRS